jgi:DNA-binding YbaB/EbfC family protein
MMGKNNMMKMMQDMQKNMAAMQQELSTIEVEGTAGQGKVRARANGHQDILSIKIDPEVVDPEDVEMLEDLVHTAVRDAIEKSKAMSSQKMSSLTAGLPIPPGML